MSVGIRVPLPTYTLKPGVHRRQGGGGGLRVDLVSRTPDLAGRERQPVPRHRRGDSLDLPPLLGAVYCTGHGRRGHHTITLATGITLVTERHPLMLAKAIAVLDLHSHGRLLCGVGAGWNRQETTIMGGDFDHRWTQAQEAVMALKAL
jgi:hypothetical protein